MPERSGYAAGMPSWVDVVVPDLEGGKAFYGGLFGWDFDTNAEEYGYYTMCRLDGRPVAGMMPTDPDTPQPMMWNVYLASDNIDATASAAAAEGGAIVAGPRDVADQGRMLYVTDPTGAAVGFWQAARLTGARVVGEPGAMCWHELITREPLIADHFYRSLFPYEVEQITEGETEDVAAYKVGGMPVASRMRMSTERPRDMVSHWMTYFGVPDTDAAVSRIGELGGRVTNGPVDSPYGPFAACTDPFGAFFSVITPSPGPAS